MTTKEIENIDIDDFINIRNTEGIEDTFLLAWVLAVIEGENVETYGDVYDYYENLAEKEKNSIATFLNEKVYQHALNKYDLHRKTRGYVYAIEFEDGITKIGRSKTKNRHKQLENAWCEIVSYKYYEFGNMFAMEKKAHEEFSDFRVKMEYFKVAFEDVCKYLKLESLKGEGCDE